MLFGKTVKDVNNLFANQIRNKKINEVNPQKNTRFSIEVVCFFMPKNKKQVGKAFYFLKILGK
jgi:hypothetical protein